ncbi:c-type cytochrome [Endothiovibrio diazotrophicus]
MIRTLVVFLLLLSVTLPATAREPDPQIGEEINEVCAGCHGEFGEGGKAGEYPRLAGQPAGYIARQLRLFRARIRANMPMLPHTAKRELPDEDIEDISAYLAAIRLQTRLPPADEEAPGFDAYARLLAAKRVLNIPRAPGDVPAGGKLYRRECRTCHGEHGAGRADKAVPMLAGQYTGYLQRQVKKYLVGERIHDADAPEERLLAEFSPAELRDILAYLSVMDDR